MKVALGTTVVVATALAFATREAVAGTSLLWPILGVPYLALAAFAVYRLWDDGTLLDTLRLRGGDVTIGVLEGGALLGVAWAVRQAFFQLPDGRTAWLFRLSFQLGLERPSAAVLALVAGLAALEEVVWRGLVLGEVSQALGARRAWPVTALLYALAHLPTVFTLGDASMGPNPLLLLGALGAGLVWTFTASILGRLPPVIVAHVAFSYFAVAMLLPRFG